MKLSTSFGRNQQVVALAAEAPEHAANALSGNYAASSAIQHMAVSKGWRLTHLHRDSPANGNHVDIGWVSVFLRCLSVSAVADAHARANAQNHQSSVGAIDIAMNGFHEWLPIISKSSEALENQIDHFLG